MKQTYIPFEDLNQNVLKYREEDTQIVVTIELVLTELRSPECLKMLQNRARGPHMGARTARAYHISYYVCSEGCRPKKGRRRSPVSKRR